MSSLHKASPQKISAAWTPPALEPQTAPSNIRREQIQNIFQKNAEGESVPRKRVHKEAQKSVSAWQPEAMGAQTTSARQVQEWSFVEIKNTPFDKDWQVQTPGSSAVFATQFNAQAEDEAAQLLATARRQAEEMILAAQTQADEILIQAQNEIEEQRQQAAQQARDEVRAEIGDAINAAKKMTGEVAAWKSELTSQGEQILVGMIKDIAAKMFGEGVELDAHTLQTHLNHVMENAHGLGALKIFLNPHDARLLDSYWTEQQMLVLGEQVKIVPSNNIKPGGCLIKGNMGTVDGRVETQLDAILKTFDEAEE